jgi:hypothetical protein
MKRSPSAGRRLCVRGRGREVALVEPGASAPWTRWREADLPGEGQARRGCTWWRAVGVNWDLVAGFVRGGLGCTRGSGTGEEFTTGAAVCGSNSGNLVYNWDSYGNIR